MGFNIWFEVSIWSQPANKLLFSRLGYNNRGMRPITHVSFLVFMFYTCQNAKKRHFGSLLKTHNTQFSMMWYVTQEGSHHIPSVKPC